MPPIKGDDGLSGIPAPGTFGVLGESKGSFGVVGTSGGTGLYGEGTIVGCTAKSAGIAVRGISPNQGASFFGNDSLGVAGQSVNGTGVQASSTRDVALKAFGRAAGAAIFFGDVTVVGKLITSTTGFFIDHPLDPANKYLHHSSVESTDRKNIYDGVAVLDGKGEAVVKLPEWFSALNRDFRYQLTCLGRNAPVFVAQEIEDNRFRIAGGSPGLKVSWLVTGIRHDPWAKINPLTTETKKPEKERGTFLYPAIYGQPEEKDLQRVSHPEKLGGELPQELAEIRPQAR